jgi:signal transduction histidine kinase
MRAASDLLVSYPSRRVGPPRLPRRPSGRTLVGAAVFGAIVALAVLSLRLDAAGPDWGVRLENSADGTSAVAAIVRSYGVAWGQGLRPGDRVLLVDDADARSFVGQALGSAHRLTAVDAQGRERVIQPPRPPGTVKLALVLAALLFALLGAAVYRWSSDATLGAIFLLFCGATAAALTVIPGALTGSAWANVIAASSSIVAAPALAAVFLWFPRQLRWARVVAGLLAVGAVALVVPTAAVFVGERAMPPLLDGLLFAWLSASLLGGAGLLAARATKASERHTLGPIVIGVALGVAPLALLHALPRAFAQPPIMRVEVAALATVAIPLVFAYAISRRRLFALDAYLRGLFVRACGGAVMVAVSVVAWLSLRGIGLDEELAAVTGVVLAALAAPTVFANVQRALDSWFYPPLRLARSQLADAETASSIATAVAARVRELVPTAWAACLVRGGEDPEGGGWWSAAGSDGEVPSFLQDWLRGGQALPDEASEGASVVAIEHARGRLGVVVVGPRLDGTPLGGVDVETIRLLARGAAAPLEAALLRERAEEESRFRQGLGQLARDLAAVGSSEAVLRLTAAYARGLLSADRATIWLRGPEPGLTELSEPRDEAVASRAPRDLGDLLGGELVSHLRQHGVVRGAQPADHADSGIAGGPLLAFAVDELGLGGALVLMARERWGRLFTATDQRRAVEIADHAGEALRRARMSAQAAEVEALRELDRARTEVVEILAHDLQNPLMAIAGHAYKLQVMAGRLDAAAVAETAGRLLGLAGRTQGLVGDLVTSNGYERGRLALRPESVDLGQFLIGLVATYRLLPGGDRLRVDAPEGIRAAADPARLEQVVGNLLQNALRYAPSGPIVLGAGHRPSGEVWIEVRDLGPGIPTEEQPHVWEKFYRTSEGVRVARAGTGIGLWVVRTLAELHGGRAELESTPGSGSIFRIVLPRTEEGVATVDG